jgi:large conductance mechanosensitive channel
MFKGFKEFILRGNVIDLAVAVVIGAAFSAVVTSLVTNIFNPLIGSLFKADSLDSLLVVEIPTLTGEPAKLLFGTVIAAVIQFLLVAVVVYFVVIVPINYLSKVAFSRRAKEQAEEEAKPAPPTELELLAQIRDLLAATEAGNHGKHKDAPDSAEAPTPSI